MAKGYWIATYHSVSDPEALAKYAALAAKVIEAHGGRFLARGIPQRVFEAADVERCVVVEFDSVGAAVSAYESDAYQEALAILKGAVVRGVRIVEGV